MLERKEVERFLLHPKHPLRSCKTKRMFLTLLIQWGEWSHISAIINTWKHVLSTAADIIEGRSSPAPWQVCHLCVTHEG